MSLTLVKTENTEQLPLRPHNAGPSAIWSSAASAYDEISRGIADAIEHCVERLAPQPEECVLDVATGTGWTARRAADRGAVVAACDFAPEMVNAAVELSAARGYDIAFEEGDAEALPYADGSFDAVISTFGVMFAQRPEDAAKELARVCRRGGRLALATWTPNGNVFEMFKIMKSFMPVPEAPPPSPFAWGEPERVEELLGNDFELTFEHGTSYYREPSGQAAWQTFYNGYGPLHTLVSKLNIDDCAELNRRFVAFHESYAGPMGPVVPRTYWVVSGVRR